MIDFWTEFLLYAIAVIVTVAVLARPIGAYVYRVVAVGPASASRWMRLESAVWRGLGIDPTVEMGFAGYARALIAFNVVGGIALYLLLRLQGHLPLALADRPGFSPDLSFNTALSFLTNTNWQAYSGDNTLNHSVQMAGLTVQNFLSAATGISVAVALGRGLGSRAEGRLGNFWADCLRTTVYVLLPGAILLALYFGIAGAVQTLQYDAVVHTVEGAVQHIAVGPVASQEAIKMFGTNGGGFFGANSAHPFENPTALSNFVQIVALLCIPFALTYTFGLQVGRPRDARLLRQVMLGLLVALAFLGGAAEQRNAVPSGINVSAAPSALQSGGLMEGKETRFGIVSSTLFTAATTGTSTGATDASIDSMTAMGTFVPLFLIQLSELTPGGVGSGIYTMVVYALLAVFIAGLMIGRTPEYLGKKIEATEMKLVAIFVLVTPALVLIGTAVAVLWLDALKSVGNPGARGFTEILYGYSSAANNNGSSMGGLNANTPFFNISLGIAMFLGRFWPIVAALGLADAFSRKRPLEPGPGTMPTSGLVFGMLLVGTIVLVGVLTFVPALTLGPVADALVTAGGTAP